MQQLDCNTRALPVVDEAKVEDLLHAGTEEPDVGHDEKPGVAREHLLKSHFQARGTLKKRAIAAPEANTKGASRSQSHARDTDVRSHQRHGVDPRTIGQAGTQVTERNLQISYPGSWQGNDWPEALQSGHRHQGLFLRPD